jgi:hypothetical protein
MFFQIRQTWCILPYLFVNKGHTGLTQMRLGWEEQALRCSYKNKQKFRFANTLTGYENRTVVEIGKERYYLTSSQSSEIPLEHTELSRWADCLKLISIAATHSQCKYGNTTQFHRRAIRSEVSWSRCCYHDQYLAGVFSFASWEHISRFVQTIGKVGCSRSTKVASLARKGILIDRMNNSKGLKF